MSTQPPAQFSVYTTEPKQSKPKMVTQRRVYGKRRVNAPRAVFDQPSPARDTTFTEVRYADPVEGLQAKLAQVTIQDDSAPQDATNTQSEQRTSRQTTSNKSIVSTIEDLPNSPIAKSSIISSPSTTQPPLKTKSTSSRAKPSTKPKPRPTETMVEVQICSNPTELPHTRLEIPDITLQHPADDRERSQTPFDRRRTTSKDRAAMLLSGSVIDSAVNDYVRPILKEALSPIAAQGVQKFDSWASHSEDMFYVAKLAEGSFGDVYKLHLREETCRPAVSKSKLAKLKSYGDGVFKVMPLRAKKGVGSKKHTSIDDIVSEVKMLKYLDPVPGFARFREIHVVQGRYPASFQTAWDQYKKTNKEALNPNPSSKRSYPDSQIWAILEMDDAGYELEKFAWSSIFQIYDIFWGVAMALARAELFAEFEHRDLHLGNVCIRSTRDDGRLDPPTELEIVRHSSSSGFGISTLQTTIIDYSLSRAELLQGDDPANPKPVVAFTDLDKQQIFDGISQDEDEMMQRNTYRYMRAALYTGNPLETEKVSTIPGIWEEYAPRTNLVWLLFMLQTLLKNRKPEAPTAQLQRVALAARSPNRKIANPQTAKGKEQNQPGLLIRERQTMDLQAGISQLQNTLEDRLKAVLELLDLEHGHEDMCCAGDLVAYAMDSQWLAEEDFY
ncbi:uncharacterized protein N7515_005330 [Penicillium bovifimosum]|uniref:non-specific serine/threonine protein kinase n=1 Tax=Penicillium bovifimosum TaxID=126998 RepID=A0A9W9KZQ6_9EURO|nr:uncharacterized protein N7515_005330 [Penicillium bovifimosum]KAJ5129291.1 hypothetical protein N7515_005330 [Penicillium bovifimosum]